MSDTILPRLPRPLALAATPLPLAPISLMLTTLTRRLAQNHPGLLRRLGVHAKQRFLLDLTDLPFLLLLEPGLEAPRVKAFSRRHVPDHEARISGLTAAFLGMMHGSLDGDALFFSRDLVIDGDTAAALALRNAIDNSELDLGAELVAAMGAFGPMLGRMLPVAERLTGLALHRMDLPTEGVRP